MKREQRGVELTQVYSNIECLDESGGLKPVQYTQ